MTTTTPPGRDREAVARVFQEVISGHYANQGWHLAPFEDPNGAWWRRADAIIAEHIAPLRAENETLRARVAALDSAATIATCLMIDALMETKEKEAELVTLRAERDGHKLRGDNHAETLRGVRKWIRAGDIGRALLWISDGLAGYTELAETTLSDEIGRREAAEAERDAAIARAEEAEKRATEMERGKAAAMGLQQGGSIIIRELEDRVATLTADLAQVKALVAGYRERIKTLKPIGERPCDCMRCDCGNVGDARAVADWDQQSAIYAALTLTEHPHAPAEGRAD